MIDLRALHRDLLQRHGPQGWWWPGEEPFEIAVGAMLVQRSRWEQAEVSIAGLRRKGLLSPTALASAEGEVVRELVRGSGFATVKPRRVIALARWWEQRAEAAALRGDAELRVELLSVEGVPPQGRTRGGARRVQRPRARRAARAHRRAGEVRLSSARTPR